MREKKPKAPYKAVVVRPLGDDGIHVFVQLRDGSVMDYSIGMTDLDSTYEHFDDGDIGLAWLTVADGTERVDLEPHLDGSNPRFDDIYFGLRAVKRVCVYDGDRRKVPVLRLIEDNNFASAIAELFDREMTPRRSKNRKKHRSRRK